MGQQIILYHVCNKGYSTHYYAIHSCPINIWLQFNIKSTSQSRLGNNQERKQDLINEGNRRENRKRIFHAYKQGDKVLLKDAWGTIFNQDAYIRPYIITAIRNNSTLRACKGRVTDTFNI